MDREIANLRERAERQLADAVTLPQGDPSRVAILTAAGETYAAAQDFERADDAWELALAEADAHGNVVAAAVVRLQRAALDQVRTPDGVTRYLEVAEELQPLFERAGDEVSMYRLHQNAARAYAIRGDAPRAREAARLALAHAERAGNEDVYCTYLLANMELEGDTAVVDIMQRAAELLPRGGGLTTWALQAFAECNAWLGRFDQARAFARQHVRLWQESGRVIETELGGIVELWAGDPMAAEAALRPVVDGQEAHGDIGHGSGSLSALTRAVLEQGRVDEVHVLLDRLERWAASDDVRTQAELRMMRGRVESDPAPVLEAIALLQPTEYLNVQAAALLDLQAVTGERAAAEQALALYERKGNETGERLARDRVEGGE